jgi:hypothetical protein
MPNRRLHTSRAKAPPPPRSDFRKRYDDLEARRDVAATDNIYSGI